MEALDAAVQYGASVPGVTPTDTQKEIDGEGFITRHLVRSSLTAVQTPQCFEFSKLLEAHGRAASDGKEYTDDTEIWGVYCGRVKVTKGDVNNIKITSPSDLEKLNAADDKALSEDSELAVDNNFTEENDQEEPDDSSWAWL